MPFPSNSKPSEPKGSGGSLFGPTQPAAPRAAFPGEADAVFAVRELPCFQEKGSGVVFRVPVGEFVRLGR